MPVSFANGEAAALGYGSYRDLVLSPLTGNAPNREPAQVQ